MKTAFNERIYFYCCPEKVGHGNSRNEGSYYYHHAIVVLGEGLKELGVPFNSNINYWKLSPNKEEYLFNHDPNVTPADCSIVVCCNLYLISGGLPDDLFQKNRKYITACLEMSDEDPRNNMLFQPAFRQFDFIFKAHYSTKSYYPPNIYPWAFGVSQRILSIVQNVPDFSDKKQNLLINYRHGQHPHTLRKHIERTYLSKVSTVLQLDTTIDQSLNLSTDDHSPDPYTLMQAAQSNGRHYPPYYERLKDSIACACFGGFFISSHPKNQSTMLSKNLRRIITRLNLKTDRLIQWDSWRLWESLVAGCVSFHVDFEKYGMLLPVMPENWVHYIGIDLDNTQESIDRLAQEPTLLKTISENGRQWALKHYSPMPMALDFLKTVAGQ